MSKALGKYFVNGLNWFTFINNIDKFLTSNNHTLCLYIILTVMHFIKFHGLKQICKSNQDLNIQTWPCCDKTSSSCSAIKQKESLQRVLVWVDCALLSLVTVSASIAILFHRFFHFWQGGFHHHSGGYMNGWIFKNQSEHLWILRHCRFLEFQEKHHNFYCITIQECIMWMFKI